MYYGEIKNVILRMDQSRISLFVSGCQKTVSRCFNKETWDFAMKLHDGDKRSYHGIVVKPDYRRFSLLRNHGTENQEEQ